MNEKDPVLIEIDAPLMRITLQRPHCLNALDRKSHFILAEAFDRFSKDASLRVATITGSGSRAFCVGTDLKERAEEGKDNFPETGFAGLTQRFDLFKPVVALVNGDAIGGGLEIILACDLALSVNHARFGLPEPRIGLAAFGGLHRLSRSLPMKHVMEIALRGKLFDAPQARAYGLINQVITPEDFEKEADCLIDDLIAAAPLAQAASKQLMMQGLEVPSIEEAFEKKYPIYDQMLKSRDAEEGSRAFLEKRSPVWSGR